jgi:hypothetical protein
MNSNYDNFHCGGDFSHAYEIMHKYFGKNTKKCKKWVHKFFIYNLGPNSLRCTTKDKKDLVLNGILFYLIFWFPSILMNQNVSNIL